MSGGEKCPNCGAEGVELIPVDSGLRARMMDVVGIADPPEFVCENCRGSLKDQMSQGALLRAAEKQKEEQKRALWSTRVAHVKKGRQLMQRKMLSEAAVAYEKYLRVLEVVLEIEPGKLSYKDFKEKHQKKELTVIASVYWDLMLVYDSSNRYGDRLQTASKKLIEIARFTPLLPDLVKRANSYRKRAKNPVVFKEFVKLTQENRPRCFVATCLLEDPRHPSLLVLRSFRDGVLRHRPWGRKFIAFYYKNSPHWCRTIDRYWLLKKILRPPLRVGVFFVHLLLACQPERPVSACKPTRN